MATGTIMKGTIIANNAAVIMNTGVSLEGRALSTTGAISVNGILSYTPIGCASPILNGPVAPDLKSTECYAIFSSNGAVSNAGITTVTGDIGTNVGLTIGFNALNVTGVIHPIPDTSTAQAAADLIEVYNYLNVLPYDIELLYPAQFGNDLVLTPHTYLLNAATVFTNTLYLNAEGNANAIFVIQINGALSTSTYAKVILTNGAQAKNVCWKVDGAVLISEYSEFKGTIVANNGALDLTTGVAVDGRVFSTTGALNTAAVSVVMTVGCPTMGLHSLNESQKVSVYPNPFHSVLNIVINDNFEATNTQIILYDSYGKEVKRMAVKEKITTLETSNLTSGLYLYKIISNGKIIQTGKLLAK